MSEYQWKDIGVVGFDELIRALDRADRKGYMPDAIKEEWEAFNWKPAQQQRKPWVGLTDEEIVQLSQEWPPETNDWASHIDFTRAIEAKLKEKNT